MKKTDRLPDEVLENAISVYKTTVKATEGLSEDEYSSALDKVTIQFLEELQEYRRTWLSPEQVRKLQQDCTGRMLLSDEYLAIGTLEECREAVERMKMQCHCKDCIHVDCAGCRGKTVYCMKHECYMQEDDFCNHAEAEAALEKMKGE